MLTSDFDYSLPPDLIAQTPVEPRDISRLMVIDKDVHKIEHKYFFDIINYLQEGDLLVWNNTKVFKARLRGEILLDIPADDIDDAREAKLHVTGKFINSSPVEIFLVRPMENKYVWKVLAKPGRKLRLGMKIRFASDFEAEVMLKEKDGTILMQFAEDDLAVRAKANLYGEVPVPPYIQNPPSRGNLDELYQTVYAKHEGSVAAPTAGFHFTPELIEKLEKKGVQFAEVTLHVGLGTFLSVKTERVEDHKMHSEWVEITAKNADLINQAKQEGRRVVAVGTTTVRTLEGAALLSPPARGGAAAAVGGGGSVVQPYTGDINIFITPEFKFQIVDALITNFHLPKSTLLMLVAAFVGDRSFILRCYQEAVKEKYRFYSFG
ncbi:MAG: tRNA preQ1(34) S-adenosylmethionine ribosyltransferase-isomerase QueA, partial [Candidatus Magasanikbacteria bacterium]|nr:tRNA preQ1(34) S-adenosylmethionine ribosyltransferase-isomerase QueA [Candidatus Magasanikbacteria bacterium]